MYIKYLNNIHNINNYYSLVKGGGKNNCIQLTKHDGTFYSLEFLNSESRDFVLNEIWNELKKGTHLYDIDEMIQTYYDAKRYNI